MRGQLPKAYLRLDPNSDQHPDRDGLLLLTCSANRQHPRGRFLPDTVVALLGRKRAKQWMAPRPGRTRPELVEQPDGTLYLDGWDEMQEGDWTVNERMQRLRHHRNAIVTSPVTPPSPEASLDRHPPSEASGVKALGVDVRTERALVVSDSEKPPLSEEDRKEFADAVWTAFLTRTKEPPTRMMVPGEYEVLRGWLTKGIPLRVVLRGIEQSRGVGRMLGYFHPSVLEAYETWRQAVPA